MLIEKVAKSKIIVLRNKGIWANLIYMNNVQKKLKLLFLDDHEKVFLPCIIYSILHAIYINIYMYI